MAEVSGLSPDLVYLRRISGSAAGLTAGLTAAGDGCRTRHSPPRQVFQWPGSVPDIYRNAATFQQDGGSGTGAVSGSLGEAELVAGRAFCPAGHRFSADLPISAGVRAR